jgi:hypothetical protein
MLEILLSDDDVIGLSGISRIEPRFGRGKVSKNPRVFLQNKRGKVSSESRIDKSDQASYLDLFESDSFGRILLEETTQEIDNLSPFRSFSASIPTTPNSSPSSFGSHPLRHSD